MKKLFAPIVLAVCAAFTASAATLNLANVTKNTTVADGTTLKGTLDGKYKISIAAGARVTLKGVTINTGGGAYPGLTCLGDATITLSGKNVVNARSQGYPGIFVPYANKLRIKGTGSLTVSGYGNAAGIGTGKSHGKACGEISIEGGDITAYGGCGSSDGDYSGNNCPGIGAVDGVSCRAISILRGNVNAYANKGASGIESPYSQAPAIGASSSVDCPRLTIGEAIGKVYAEATHLVEPVNVGSITKDESLSDTGSVAVGESSHVIGDRAFKKRTITSHLGSLRGSKTFQNGDVLIGELVNDYKISIAHGATVTLRNVTIPGSSRGERPGIHCLGDATIILEGVNTVASYGEVLSAIFVTEGKTLTIRGSGSLKAIGGDYAAGIGGSYIGGIYDPILTAGKDYGPFVANAGMIVIESGDVVAKGGASGIGGGCDSTCQAVEIKGGYVRASYVNNSYSFNHEPIKTDYLSIPGLVDGSMKRTTTEDTITVQWGGDLSKLTATDNHHPIAADGTVIRGRLTSSLMRKISIAAGASVTLQDVTISGYHYDQYPWAGLTCLGDATITLVGASSVKTYHDEYPGIYVPEGNTLTFKGDGTIEARARANTGYAAGIGSGKAKECSIAGNVIIENGIVDAKGNRGSGIGGVNVEGNSVLPPKNFGYLAINGGLVKAWSGRTSDNYIGIGAGASCGKVTIASNMMQTIRDLGALRYMVVSWDGTLGTVDRNVIAVNGTTITGTLGGVESRKKISIEPDATVTLSDVQLLGTNNPDLEWAGLTCLGNATINLEGENKVKGFYQEYPAIYIPNGFNLVINGPGSLKAMVNGGPSAGSTAAIGAGKNQVFGNITINGGTITAEGCQNRGAGIGGATFSECTSTITINGGNVTATGGKDSAGIGSGGSRCGAITINGGTVSATGGDGASGIGNSSTASGTCSAVKINSGITCVTATAGTGGTPIASATTPSVAKGLSDTTSGLVRTIKWSGSLSALSMNGTSGMEVIATDGMTINGTLSSKACKITIAPDAHVTLNNAKINTNGTFSDNTKFAGITCLGNATIELLKNSVNEINTFNADYPGIYVPHNCKLTITGKGKLVANSQNAAGIGGGTGLPCGTISIQGGDVLGFNASGLAAGIGGGEGSRCDGVEIFAGITKVEAYSSDSSAAVQAQPVGAGKDGTCYRVHIGEGVVEQDADTFATGHPFRRTFTSPYVDLSDLTDEIELKDGDIVTGTLSTNLKVTVKSGATIVLSNARIGGEFGTVQTANYPGIICKGNVKILLEGDNYVTGYNDYPAIWVVPGSTLTIDVRYGGDDWMGRLFATGGSVSAAIGAVGGQGATYWSEYASRNCGTIQIDGGTVYAYGGGSAAGIGAGGWGGNGAQVRCGGVTINGGTVYAYGGSNAAGIGAGHGAGITPSQSGCGTITIGPGITKVVATKGSGTYTQTLPIGKSQTSSDVTVNIDSGLRSKVVDGVQTIVPDPDVDLSSLESFGDPVVVRDEATVSGTLGANRQVVIADGATVTLSDMTMDNSRSKGLACLGDATIILEGENFIRANVNGYAGLFVPEGHTLTIKGSGSLEVYGGGGEGAAGIGAGLSDDSSAAGDIVIEGGVIKAVGGFASAGIGASQTVSCGTIAILDGSVTAIGGEYANGIGAGWDTHCAGVTIENGIDYLSATCNGDDVNDCVPIGTLPDDASGVTVYGGLVEESSETPDPNDPDCFTRNRTFLPAELDLSKLPEDMTELTLQDGMTIKGTLGHACKVSIAPGAHIGLWEAKILGENNSSYSWAGLTCLGDATIRLRYGSSRICGFYDEYPGIYVPEGSTLTIEGTPGQQLIASSNGYAAGIGGGWYISCGSIVVNGGKVIAIGWQSSSGNSGAGIGGGYNASCDGVVINGGDVTAYGGHYAAGIGSGDTGSCGGIAINGGTVRATGGGSAPGIGAGGNGSCGDITIAEGISRVEATPGDGASSAIGEGNGATCGDVHVDDSLDDQVDDTLKRVIRAYEVVDLSTVTSDIVLNDMTVATGTLATPCKVSIAAGARVRLRDVDINGAGEWTSYSWAGLTCLGDATIDLEGSNSVKGFDVSFAGIYVPADTTLTITGEGFLDVAAIHESGETYGAAGIGGNGGTSYYNSKVRHAGNIVFAGGKVVAWGGNNSSAIGCSNMNNCGDITFERGIISVEALNGGIGKVYAGGTEGTITIAPELERTGNYICHPWDGNLDTLDRDATAKDGLVIYGTSDANYKVYIAEGATVTLSDANSYGRITCRGDATIILQGENVASISGAKDYTLTIKGDGSLLAGSENYPWAGAPGIGGGNIVIESGTIEARSFAQAVHAAAIGAGAAAEDSCGTITIGPGVTKVVATINKTTNYTMNAQPIGVGDYSSCGTITVDPSLSDVTSESSGYITRTISRAPDAGVAAAYNAWATENGVSGAWDATDANGVPNAFRYVFDQADASFTGVVIIGFYCLGDGAVAIQTLPIVNGKDVFTFTIVASDNADGSGNIAEYPLAIDDPEGITIIEEEYNPNRFFRVKVDVK